MRRGRVLKHGKRQARSGESRACKQSAQIASDATLRRQRGEGEDHHATPPIPIRYCLLLFLISTREAPQSGRYHGRERERSMRSSRISASRPRKKKKQGRRNKRSRGHDNNNNDKKEVENRCLVSLRSCFISFNHELKFVP